MDNLFAALAAVAFAVLCIAGKALVFRTAARKAKKNCVRTSQQRLRRKAE